MKTSSSDNTNSCWQKTPVANPVRHVQSEDYYARIRVRGKLIWKSLKTDRISVAKLRLSNFHKDGGAVAMKVCTYLRDSHSTIVA